MQIDRKIVITYRWWHENDIPDDHVEILEKHAESRISEMTQEGYLSGELNENIFDDMGEEIEYSGWWEVKKS